MLRSRTNGLINALSIALCALLILAFWGYLGFLSLVYFGEDELTFPRYGYYCLIAAIGLLIQLVRADESALILSTADFFRTARQALLQTAYVAGAMLFTLVLTKDDSISRFFLFSFLGVLYVVLLAGNLIVPRLLCRIFFHGRHAAHALVIGNPENAGCLAEWLRAVKPYGFEVKGFLSLAPTKREQVIGLPVLGDLTNLPDALRDRTLQTVLLLDVPEQKNVLRYILEETERCGTRLITVNTLTERFGHSLRYMHQFGMDFIMMREEPLEDPMGRILKRTLDILIALPVVLFLLPPLMVLVAIFHRLQSPGPLFYRQIRTGMKNQRFSILKFRTMRVEHADHAQQATEGDARIFPFGRVLRKTSLDEFPQFWNVLTGSMSVVGPRPHMPEHDALFARAMRSYHIRSLAKPGITGLAQIRGFRGEAKSNEDIRRRVECDIDYIERWCLTLDYYIILKTALQVLFPPKTAY